MQPIKRIFAPLLGQNAPVYDVFHGIELYTEPLAIEIVPAP